MSVCSLAYRENHKADIYQILCVLPASMTRSSSDRLARSYAFPVLWITMCFHSMRVMGQNLSLIHISEPTRPY